MSSPNFNAAEGVRGCFREAISYVAVFAVYLVFLFICYQVLRAWAPQWNYIIHAAVVFLVGTPIFTFIVSCLVKFVEYSKPDNGGRLR